MPVKKTTKTIKTTKKSLKKTKKTKKTKKPMPKGFGYCTGCRKTMEMHTTQEKTTKNGRKQLVGKCKFGHSVFRFI